MGTTIAIASKRESRARLDDILTDEFSIRELDEERIEYFVELIKDGHPLDPIKLGIKGEGIKKLIDGRHRFEAHRRCGLAEISYTPSQLPEKLWILEAIRLNSKSSKPLTRGEFTKAVRTAQDKGLSLEEIREQLSSCCSVRYIQRLLSPMAKQQRQERDSTIQKLKEQGHSRREIAKKLDIPDGTVKSILERNTEEADRERNEIEEHTKHIRLLLGDITPSGVNISACLFCISQKYLINKVQQLCGLQVRSIVDVAVATLYLLQDGDRNEDDLVERFPHLEEGAHIIAYMCSYISEGVPSRTMLYQWILANCRADLNNEQRKIVLKERTEATYQSDKPKEKLSIGEFRDPSAIYLKSLQIIFEKLKSPETVDKEGAVFIAERINQINILHNHVLAKIRPHLG